MLLLCFDERAISCWRLNRGAPSRMGGSFVERWVERDCSCCCTAEPPQFELQNCGPSEHAQHVSCTATFVVDIFPNRHVLRAAIQFDVMSMLVAQSNQTGDFTAAATASMS